MDMLPEKLYIIAGTYEQALHFKSFLLQVLRSEGIYARHIDIIPINHINTLRGCGKGVWGYRCGSWAARPDIEEIQLMLLSRDSTIDNFIEVEI